MTVDVDGSVRFALLYWAGRDRPCPDSPPGSGNCVIPAEPYLDQELLFDGTPITGTIIGTEHQPVSPTGPINNIGYFADVTALVAAKGMGTHSFGIADGNTASNLLRLNGASLIVGWIDPSTNFTFRVLVHDGLDFAWGEDPTPGDNRVTAPVTLDHGMNLSDRMAELLVVWGDNEVNRPERIDVSNNPSLFNEGDESSGFQWDHDAFDVTIPAGVGSTTVQVFSEPVGQFPDSTEWEVVALRVRQLDVGGITCPITLNDPGPPARIEVTFRDTGTGLASLEVTKSINADTVVPPFTPGTTDPVVVSATKIDQSQKAQVEIIASDLAGNTRVCDPILLLLSRDGNTAVTDTVTGVPAAEGFVTLTNGDPGLKKIDVIVNGTRFKVAGLKDGEERTLDVTSAMKPGDANVVQFEARGPKGAWTNVMLWDGVTE